MRPWLRGYSLSRSVLVAVTVLSANLVPGVARADDVQDCLDAHEKSQVMRKDGKLRDARDALLTCARDVCPAVIRKECGPWLGQVNNAIPTVTFAARKDGHDLVDVKVTMDGELLASQLDGRAVDVDPGPHTFVFETTGAKPLEMKVVVREGEKAREVVADFGGNVAAAPPGTGSGTTAGASTPGADAGASRPIPTLTYVLGGVGIAALAGSAFFELRGLSKRSDLDSQNCKPYCDAGEVDSAKQSILIGDIALGVGVASLGTAAFFYFTRPEVPNAPKQRAAGSMHFDVTALTGGAAAGVSGSF